MNSLALKKLVSQAVKRSHALTDPADCVLALAPLTLDLIEPAGSFLEPRHYASNPDHYARNLIYAAPDLGTRRSHQLCAESGSHPHHRRAVRAAARGESAVVWPHDEQLSPVRRSGGDAPAD